MIVLNLKTYAETTGENGLKLIKIAHDVSKKSHSKIIVCPQATQLHYARKNTAENFWFFAQHADSAGQGKFTGSITVEAIAAEGCGGTLLNHAEKQVSFEDAAAVVEKAGKIGLKTIVCANTVEKAVSLAGLKPWAIAVEVPELIGTLVSISKVKPEIVERAVDAVKSVDKRVLVLAGAGVADAIDYEKSLELGAEGAILATAFVKAKDPREWLESLARVKH